MIAISYMLHAGSVLLLLWMARSIRHRGATERALGNVLASTANLNAGSVTGDILARSVQQHYNVAASCVMMARFATGSAWLNAALLVWRVSTW